MGNGFSVGTNLSYDEAFDGRVSADILYRFATPEAVKAPTKKAWNAPTIKGLTDAVDNRGVRVHDGCIEMFREMLLDRGIENLVGDCAQ
jgi:hypothetical protein